jgi:cytoskeletal protein CcmA (bactofilin family)
MMSDTNSRPNSKIAGAGDMSGGVYGDVTIAGAGNVRGDVDAITFKVAGTGDIQGKLSAGTVSVSGNATFNGDVHAGTMTVSGTADVRGALTADVFKVAGSTTITGRVDAQRIEIRGTTKIGGDAQAEVFDAQGIFSVGGLLNAGSVSIRLYGGCDARDIGGERIDVQLGKTWPFIPFFGERNLTADTIEGDVVYLENTRAKVVRGGDVRIGAGCEIDLVEYTGTFVGAEGVRASRKVEAGSTANVSA